MTSATETPLCQVDLQPVGRRISVPAGTTLLDAARQAGVELVAICGGEGVCGDCRVRAMPGAGQLSAPTLTETAELPAADLAQGMRLACQTHVLGGDVRIEIPPESLTAAQRLQIESQVLPAAVIQAQAAAAPVITLVDIRLEPPSLEDLRSDLARLRASLAELGHSEVSFDLRLLADLSNQLRSNNWHVRLALRGEEVVAALAPDQRIYGLAVDVGTTKLAAYLVDLESGQTAAQQGAMNPQIAYGEDVISRIHYANERADGAATLQSRLAETLNTLLEDLCRQVQAVTAQVVEAVIVGNTAMHHLFAGLPVRQLGEAPYVASVSEALDLHAADLGLRLAPAARVYLPPNIAGYVGADHVAMLLGAGLLDEVPHPQPLSQRERGASVPLPEREREAGAPLPERERGNGGAAVLALDIGTNTEISLFYQGKHWSCSCASGPAFEGAHIGDGMRAAPGAVERVRIQQDTVWMHTINDQPPVGICGSGILDAVAELLKAGLLGPRGNFKGGGEAGAHPRLDLTQGKGVFILAEAAESGHGRPVVVSRSDINEIQLAKGAIRAGIDVLLQQAGIPADALERFIVAGAFGTYLDIGSAIAIGMFPDLPLERFEQIGNAAGGGARRLLLSHGLRQVVTTAAEQVEYVELAKAPSFMKTYMNALALLNR